MFGVLAIAATSHQERVQRGAKWALKYISQQALFKSIVICKIRRICIVIFLNHSLYAFLGYSSERQIIEIANLQIFAYVFSLKFSMIISLYIFW